MLWRHGYIALGSLHKGGMAAEREPAGGFSLPRQELSLEAVHLGFENGAKRMCKDCLYGDKANASSRD